MMTLRRHLSLLSLALSALLIQGCASKPASLVLHPENKSVAYSQIFTQALAGHADDGSPAFLLVADDATVKAPKKTAGPIEPTTQPPLRQVVYIKVLWRPLSGTRDAIVTNAAIDWYVMSNTVEGNDDMLEYQGAGYVSVDTDDTSAKVTIHNATLRPTQTRGNLTDPIGPTRLTGTFVAQRDNARLEELLAATRARTAVVASSR